MPHSLRGIVLKIGATVAFSVMYALIKLAGAVPVGEVIFFRAVFALIPLFALSFYTIGPRAVTVAAKPVWHIIRSIAGASSMFLSFAAVKYLPLADLTAFTFLAPIFAVVLAAFILHERVGPYRGFAVVVGFAGVLLMLEPHGGLAHIVRGGFSSGAAMAIGAAALSAFVVVYIRQMSTTEKSETIVFYFMTICVLAGGATMLWARVTPSPEQTLLLIACGLLGGVGQICMTFSYRYAEPSLLAPFDYLAIIWASALGFVLFAEIPETMVMAGSGVVIGAGLFIAWRERHMHFAPIPPAQPL